MGELLLEGTVLEMETENYSRSQINEGYHHCAVTKININIRLTDFLI